ncbi:uncharacterized protein LOC111364568 [Spodoptera litura]|uniref:Uncharacterized protein LOC111364568 n=1 Tax=Spodoptera litura TaxID=69820 RepID=A0A9J7J624_SPOLT|nr:uncharacterized protein LOC111364568 [Spodoptera litura]
MYPSLDVQSMWPTHLACAQGQIGGHCIWRSGTTLVIRHEGQWKLLGIGVYGPGCESPSRFLDYGMYHLWVKRIVSKIGQPTISRIANNYVVLRRSTSNIQRFGLCDAEETTKEIFTDSATMLAPHDEYDDIDPVITAYYNVTLLENVDYHCIIFQAKKELNIPGTPLIKLRRTCPNGDNSCTSTRQRTLFYYVVIKFKHICTFTVNAYGVYIVTNGTDVDELGRLVRVS